MKHGIGACARGYVKTLKAKAKKETKSNTYDGAPLTHSFLGLDAEELVRAVAGAVDVAECACVRHVARNERDAVHGVLVNGVL